MKLVLSNPKGGRPIEPCNFPLQSDKEGNLGFLLGYVPKDFEPGDKVLIGISRSQELATQFGLSLNEFYKKFGEFKPKKSLKQRLIEYLGGQLVS